MTVLFCHDHRFMVTPDGRIFSQGQYDRTVFRRYVEIFGRVRVASRTVPLGDLDPDKLSECTMPELELVDIGNLSSLRAVFLQRAASERRLAEAMVDCDAVIARLPSEIGLTALRAARRLDKPAAVEVVACVHDGLMHHGDARARLYAPIAYRRMRRAVAQASHAIYVTQAFLQRRYPNTRGITAGVSDVDIPSDPTVPARRTARLEGGGTPVLGFVGALFHRQKGLDLAMEAVRQVVTETPEVRLRVLGSGDPAAWREEAARMGLAEHVAFEGTLPRGGPVLNWLDEIDIYLHPSYQEGLSRAIVEALSRGCTVLASTAGGTPEIVGMDSLHTPGDRGTLTDQLRRALSDAAWRRELAARNIATASEFTLERLDARRLEFWRGFARDAGLATD